MFSLVEKQRKWQKNKTLPYSGAQFRIFSYLSCIKNQ